MRKMLMALLAACSDPAEPGPHDEVPCVGWQTSIRTCERACADYSSLRIDSCDPLNLPVCREFATVDGVSGCCTVDGSTPGDVIVRWNECE